MRSTRLAIAAVVMLYAVSMAVPTHSVSAGQYTQPPELTGTLTFDAATREKVGGSVLNIVLTVGDGGTGPYKSVLVGDPGLPEHTIFRPSDLGPFGKKNPLPIVVWANGACMNTSADFRNLLSEIASHGFMVMSIGPAAGTVMGYNEGETSTSQLLDAVDWATAQNDTPGSPYYRKIATDKVAVMGMSCGGLQALEASLDPRVTTSVIWNSGVFGRMPAMDGETDGAQGGAAPGEGRGAAMPEGGAAPAPSGISMPTIDFSKDDLQRLDGPMLYITGTKDIALENAKDDFSRLTKVPVFLAIKDGAEHHDATYQEPNAGDYGVYGSAWLKWQLKGDKDAAKVFTGKDCAFCKDARWSVQKKKID